MKNSREIVGKFELGNRFFFFFLISHTFLVVVSVGNHLNDFPWIQLQEKLREIRQMISCNFGNKKSHKKSFKLKIFFPNLVECIYLIDIIIVKYILTRF